MNGRYNTVRYNIRTPLIFFAFAQVSKEIERNRNINISEYFAGDNWGIHPEWVYCRYHYLEDHEFDRPEDELRHFLKVVGDFSKSEAERFPEQYKAYDEQSTSGAQSACGSGNLDQRDADDNEPDCGNGDLDEEQEEYEEHLNDHYCNKELMELLIMDASATNASFAGDFDITYDSDRNLTRDYEVFLRFIATQSGLTRWQRIVGADVDMMEERIAEFASHKRALDEPWYKGAILQNVIDSQSVSITGESSSTCVFSKLVFGISIF